jgi:hypothetical protein
MRIWIRRCGNGRKPEGEGELIIFMAHGDTIGCTHKSVFTDLSGHPCATILRLNYLYLHQMKIVFFSSQPYDKTFFNRFNDSYGFELVFFELPLNEETLPARRRRGCGLCFCKRCCNAAVCKQFSKKELRSSHSVVPGLIMLTLEAAKKMGCMFAAFLPIHPKRLLNMHWR